MSRLLVDSIVSDSAATDLTLGASGDTVDITGDHISADTIKDSGGNTIFTSNGSGTLSSVQGEFVGSPTLLTTNTSSGDSSSDFTSSIDSTYKLYIFKFINMNPATDSVEFGFQGNAATQTGYNETMTTTFFRALHSEAGDEAALAYQTAQDQGQGTALQHLAMVIGNGADENVSGTLHLFNPSNTTYVKHFYSVANCQSSDDKCLTTYVAGYFNVTAAITNIQFKMDSGNMDGVIKMYGL